MLITKVKKKKKKNDKCKETRQLYIRINIHDMHTLRGVYTLTTTHIHTTKKEKTIILFL